MNILKLHIYRKPEPVGTNESMEQRNGNNRRYRKYMKHHRIIKAHIKNELDDRVEKYLTENQISKTDFLRTAILNQLNG